MKEDIAVGYATKPRYAHLSSDHLRAAANRIGSVTCATSLNVSEAA